jgi:hypothetical protein
MNILGPDMKKIGREHSNAVGAATNNYADRMGSYANSGAGTNPNNQRQTTASSWDVLGKVNDYLDPSIAYQQEQAGKANAAQYGSQGSLFSGAAAKGLADRTSAIAQQGWGNAFDRAMADNNRQFQNQMSIDQFNNNANQQNFSNQFGVNNQNFANQNAIQGTVLGSNVNAANTNAQLKAGEKSAWDYGMDIGKLATGIGGVLF